MSTYDLNYVARRLGLSTRTIISYWREGLLEAKMESGELCFKDEDIEELARIIRLRQLGVNLAGIEVILEMRRKMTMLRQELSQIRQEIDREVEQRFQKHFSDRLPVRLTERDTREIIEIIIEEERD